MEHGPVMKVSGKEHRNGRDGLALVFGAQISGEGHFANVELEAPHHTPHRGSYGRHFYKRGLDFLELYTSIFQWPSKSVISNCDFERLHLSGSMTRVESI